MTRGVRPTSPAAAPGAPDLDKEAGDLVWKGRGGLRWPERGRAPLDVLFPGLYAWAVTVAWPATRRFAPPGARATGAAALVALIAGSMLVTRSPRLSRLLGIGGFVASSVASWVLLARVLGPGELEPATGAAGSIGWFLFALGWGAAESAPSGTPAESMRVEQGGTPPAERPARSLPKGSASLAAAVMAGGAMTFSAWTAAGAERALLAHAVALAATLALMTAVVDLFERAAQGAPPRARQSPMAWALAGGGPPALVALALLVAGAIYLLLK